MSAARVLVLLLYVLYRAVRHPTLLIIRVLVVKQALRQHKGDRDSFGCKATASTQEPDVFKSYLAKVGVHRCT